MLIWRDCELVAFHHLGISVAVYVPRLRVTPVHRWVHGDEVDVDVGARGRAGQMMGRERCRPSLGECRNHPCCMPFLSQLAEGPIFTAAYVAPSTGTPASVDVNQIDSGVTPVNDAANAKEKSISGKAAAGVLIPLLLVRRCVVRDVARKGQRKRKLWSEVVDKRMSTISTN